MKVKTAINHDTKHASVRGIASVTDFWPQRVITIGNPTTDRKKLAGDWVRVGEDISNAFTRVVNGRR